MNRILVFFFLLTTAFTAQAQDGRGRVQAVKVGYLSERLKLSPEQAERFWPIYNRCSDERRAIRQQYRAGGTEDAAAAMQKIDDNIEYQEKEVALRKRCKEEYLKVISPQQVATLFDAERDFKKMILQQLSEKRGH